MKSKFLARSSEIASNLLLTTMSLALIVGYVFLFQLFRADRQGIGAVAQEYPETAPHEESISFLERE